MCWWGDFSTSFCHQNLRRAVLRARRLVHLSSDADIFLKSKSFFLEGEGWLHCCPSTQYGGLNEESSPRNVSCFQFQSSPQKQGEKKWPMVNCEIIWIIYPRIWKCFSGIQQLHENCVHVWFSKEHLSDCQSDPQHTHNSQLWTTIINSFSEKANWIPKFNYSQLLPTIQFYSLLTLCHPNKQDCRTWILKKK